MLRSQGSSPPRAISGGIDRSQNSSTTDVPPLTKPSTVPKNSKDLNRGLYPKPKQKTFSPGFTKASEIYACSNRLNIPAVNSKVLQVERLNDKGNLSKKRSRLCASRSYDAKIQHKEVKKDIQMIETPEDFIEVEQHKKKCKRAKNDDGRFKNTLLNYYKVSESSSKKQLLICNGGISKVTQSLPDASKLTNRKADANNFDLEQKTGYLEIPAAGSACIPSTSASYNDNIAFDSVEGDLLLAELENGCMDKGSDTHYGLFGSNSSEFETPCYFNDLPTAVIEQILCQIPFKDLLNLQSVCKNWNSVISNSKFAEWKKAYYHFKWTNNVRTSFPKALHDCLHEWNVNDCFIQMIRYMIRTFNRSVPLKMMDLLRTLPKYDTASEVIRERFPDLSSKVFNPWGIIAAMVVICESVSDIITILKHLGCNGAPCSLHDLLDAMYCIATFLLYFKNTFKINHGIHYRLYYALYLWENSIPHNVTPSQVVAPEMGIYGQQSIYSYCKPTEQRLTYEQIRILNHRLKPNQVVKIIAFAGTGKTSTLIHFARIYPQLNFLNVVFNKGVRDYASKCFPSNVECRTSHSLAYQAVGNRFRHKLSFKLKPYDILSYLRKPDKVDMHIYTYAKCVLQTLEKFTMSADEEITIAHVPYSFNVRSPGPATRQLTDGERLNFREEANALWQKMVDPDEVHCRITHDTYLKIFQLSRPKFGKYNCIMIDEAQDCNSAMLDIMLSQDVPVVLVGDPHQQIYSFRGADNALESVQATHTYQLTKSFRFGPEIAYIASCCLEVLKSHKRTTLVGCEKESFVRGKVTGQYAVIARSNFKLYEEAVRLCCTDVRCEDEPDRIQAAFAGGISGYGFDQIVDIYRLASGEERDQIKDRFVKKFASITELRSYAKNAEDSDLMAKIDLVTQYGHKVVEHVRTIKKKGSCAMELANVVFSTAHKSKGLEFDTVCLTDDFRAPDFLSGSYVGGGSDECNILYVALTRAKRCLLMCEALYRLLSDAQERFEYPFPSKDVLQDCVSLKCIKCSTEFIPHTVLTVIQKDVRLASKRNISGGPLCMKCATKPFYRPEVHSYPAVMFLDRVADIAHQSMCSLVGPLTTDPPIQYDDDDFHGFDDDDDAQPFWLQVNIL